MSIMLDCGHVIQPGDWTFNKARGYLNECFRWRTENVYDLYGPKRFNDISILQLRYTKKLSGNVLRNHRLLSESEVLEVLSKLL